MTTGLVGGVLRFILSTNSIYNITSKWVFKGSLEYIIA